MHSGVASKRAAPVGGRERRVPMGNLIVVAHCDVIGLQQNVPAQSVRSEYST